MHTIRLELTIKFLSKWHSGSGEGGLHVDRLIRRDARNWPYIPGSTLKGVVRENCEKLSRSLEFPEPSDPHLTDLSQPGKFTPLSQAPSPVDAIFGNHFEEGGLFFRNAQLTEAPVFHHAYPQSRTRRYRRLGTVKEKHLFTSEYAWPLEFQTTIDGSHRYLKSFSQGDLPYAYCLLVAGILNVERLGGDKSTGCGKVEISIASPFRYNEQPIELESVFEILDPELIKYSFSAGEEQKGGENP
ncbi:MAG: hypothetical protein JRI50_09130 [Deltaproteobacteria bacterium]|nr:hypothetical protein [Deltaproteobacteria bacterium]MBW2135658.1 hypothetical protein [Deltaproteobacteria bacterium]